MLQIVLGSHPQVATTVELTLFTRYVGTWVEQWNLETENRRTRGWNQGLPMVWNEDDFESFLREFVLRAYASVIERDPDRTHVLDKHPEYALEVETIKRLLPGARFIHVIRDGRDVACSLTAALKTIGFGAERVVEGAATWKRLVQAARTGAQFSQDYLEVRYEDLISGRIEPYEQVFRFCGLPVERSWLSRILEEQNFEKMKSRRATADARCQSSPYHYRQGKAGSWRAELSLAERFEVDRVAGGLLQELGYAQPGWWAETPIERWLEPKRFDLRRRLGFCRQAFEYARSTLSGKRPKKA